MRFSSSLQDLNSQLRISADIDECAENTDLCEQDCANTIGSYNCSCGTGFIIDVNAYSCDGMQSIWASILVVSRFLLTQYFEMGLLWVTNGKPCIPTFRGDSVYQILDGPKVQKLIPVPSSRNNYWVGHSL
jgi:hypothetical protein